MIEIDINPNFEAKEMKAHRNNSLSQIIRACEKSIAQKIRISPGVTPQDVANYESAMSTFLCTYFALAEEIDKRGVFKRERKNGYYSLVRNYSLYAASKAVLNKIDDDDIEKLRGLELVSTGSPITYSDIDQGSDFSLLSTILGKLKNVKMGNNVSVLKYNYFSFFDKIREMSKNFIKTHVHPETLKSLNQISIYKTGLSFGEIAPPQQQSKEFAKETETNKSPSGNIENLPAELLPYEPQSRPSVGNVVGNKESINTLSAAIIRVLCYDPQQKKNPFLMNGNSFKDAFLVYGDPGVGKNFTVDAILNYYKSVAEKFGKEVEFIDLSQGIHSMYRDRSAQIFERYISLENEGDKVYINVIDEADGVFTVNEHGEMCEESKKLLREMKKAINNSDKGNAIYLFLTNYAERFEAALKQRFTPLEMKGPVNADDFARLLEVELGHCAMDLSQEELGQVGTLIYQYKAKLNGNEKKKEAACDYDPMAPITGRNVHKIVAPFVGGKDDIIVANEDTILRASTEQVLAMIPKLRVKASYKRVLAEVNTHMAEVVRSTQETTARYNK